MASRLQRLRAAKKSKKLTSAVANRSANVTKRAQTSRVSSLRDASRRAAPKTSAPVNFAASKRAAKELGVSAGDVAQFVQRDARTSKTARRQQLSAGGARAPKTELPQELQAKIDLGRADARQLQQRRTAQAGGVVGRNADFQKRAAELRGKLETGFRDVFGQRVEDQKAKLRRDIQLLEAGVDPAQKERWV